MIELHQLKIPLDEDGEEALRIAAAKRLHVAPDKIGQFSIIRKAIDARDKRDIRFAYSVLADLGKAESKVRLSGTDKIIKKPDKLKISPAVWNGRPVVVGAGPAGLFAALALAQSGARPIVLERGKPIALRTGDVERMMDKGELDPESNLLFGEGGAGTFSDGKLTWRGKQQILGAYVLETFARCGAGEEAIYDARAHVGTDRLREVITAIRGEIENLGGEFRFGCCVSGIETRDGRLTKVKLRDGFSIDVSAMILCCGHSARDTYAWLKEAGIALAPKPFAVGVRVEHPQSMIDEAQFGKFAGHPALGAASYALTAKAADGRGVYSFCMCPGGEVVICAQEEGALAVNGMSYHARDGKNANSALLVQVFPEDYMEENDPLSGLRFQKAVEQKAFALGGGGFIAPAQRMDAFLSGIGQGEKFGSVAPSARPGVKACDLTQCLPDRIVRDLREGIAQFSRKLRGFDRADAVLTGAETRSSSPVRILRGEDGCAVGCDGLYPAGEGSGYAGGIVSSAVDGLQAALHLIERINRGNKSC